MNLTGHATGCFCQGVHTGRSQQFFEFYISSFCYLTVISVNFDCHWILSLTHVVDHDAVLSAGGAHCGIPCGTRPSAPVQAICMMTLRPILGNGRPRNSCKAAKLALCSAALLGSLGVPCLSLCLRIRFVTVGSKPSFGRKACSGSHDHS